MTDPDISVVIPCFRSGAWLHELMVSLDSELDRLGGSCEILLVNDGSGDGTWEAIAKLAERYRRVRGFDLGDRVGQHRATLFGLARARGAIVVTMDDDLEHRPEDVPALIAALRERPDLDCVIAGFHTERRGPLRRAASVAMDRVYRHRYAGPPGIQMTPFRAMSRALARTIAERGRSDSFIPRLLLTTTPRLANVAVEHQPSRTPSRYRTSDLLGLAWRAFAGGSSAARRVRAQPRVWVQREVGGAPAPRHPGRSATAGTRPPPSGPPLAP